MSLLNLCSISFHHFVFTYIHTYIHTQYTAHSLAVRSEDPFPDERKRTAQHHEPFSNPSVTTGSFLRMMNASLIVQVGQGPQSGDEEEDALRSHSCKCWINVERNRSWEKIAARLFVK
jgi:hypothetical protein